MAGPDERHQGDGSGPAVRFVLVETSHPGNIGSAARAVYAMGFTELVLVNPARFPHADATALAAGADQVLASARVCADLDEALAGCVRVYGTSARSRTLDWPLCDARAAAVEAAGYRQPVAFVFGRERTGLTNAELDRCHAMLTIPTGGDYASLNLAQAVQIVAYEMRMADTPAQGGSGPGEEGDPLPAHEDMERFHAHLEQTLVDIGFLDPANPKQLMRRLRRYFQRSAPTATELSILRGILRNARDPEPGSPTRERIRAKASCGDDANMGNTTAGPVSGQD